MCAECYVAPATTLIGELETCGSQCTTGRVIAMLLNHHPEHAPAINDLHKKLSRKAPSKAPAPKLTPAGSKRASSGKSKPKAAAPESGDDNAASDSEPAKQPRAVAKCSHCEVGRANSRCVHKDDDGVGDACKTCCDAMCKKTGKKCSPHAKSSSKAKAAAPAKKAKKAPATAESSDGEPNNEDQQDSPSQKSGDDDDAPAVRQGDF